MSSSESRLAFGEKRAVAKPTTARQYRAIAESVVSGAKGIVSDSIVVALVDRVMAASGVEMVGPSHRLARQPLPLELGLGWETHRVRSLDGSGRKKEPRECKRATPGRS